MRNLEQLYKEIGSTSDFYDIEVTDPNTLGMYSNRPLHIAATWGDCDAIDMLVRAGAEIDIKGEHGFTPLFEAVAQENVEAVKLLVKLGSKPIKNNDDQLPSEYASYLDNEELITYLKANGL